MTTEINNARFTISGTPSEDAVTGDRGYTATNSETLSVTLETNPSSALSVTYQVYDASDSESPMASKDAPALTWVGSGAASETFTSVNDTATIIMPSTLAHSYIIRATVSMASGSQYFERLVAILYTATTPDLRKTVPAESNQFAERGWSDEINNMVDAIGTYLPSSDTLDAAYNNFGANPATVTVDNAEGQGDITFDINGAFNVNFDMDGVAAPVGADITLVPYGVSFTCGTDSFYIGGDGATGDRIHVRSIIYDMLVSASQKVEILSNGDAVLGSSGSGDAKMYAASGGDVDIRAYTGSTYIESGGTGKTFKLEYDADNAGTNVFTIEQNTTAILTAGISGNVAITNQLLVGNGTDALPAVAFSSNVDTGLIYRSTNSGTLGASINDNATFATYHVSSLNWNVLAALAEDSPNEPWVSSIASYAHGNATIGGFAFSGLDNGAAGEVYGAFEGNVIDNTATSEDAQILAKTVIGGSLATRCTIGNGVWAGSHADPGAGIIAAENGFAVGSVYSVDSSGNVTCASNIIDGGNGSTCEIKSMTEEVTIAVGQGAAGVATSGNLAPSGTLIFGVSARVTDAPGGGAATFNIGITGSGNADELLQNVSTSLAGTGTSAHYNDGTQLPIVNASTTTLTITTNANVTGDEMKVRVIVYYMELEFPTS